MLGPSLGGLLIDWFDWRAVFWFRAPVALTALALLIALPAPTRHPAGPRFDIAGTITLILALSSFLLALNQIQRIDQNGYLPVAGFAIVFIVALAGFIRAETRADEPILKLSAFRNLEFAIINLTSCLLYLVTFSVMLLIPFLLPRIPNLSVAEAGLVLAFGFVGTSIAALLGGRLIGWARASLVGFTGVAMTGTGILAISRVQSAEDLSWMVGALLVQGIGTGLFQVSYMYIITGSLPPSERGVSGSLAMLTRTIGVVTGVTILTLSFVCLRDEAVAHGMDDAAAFQSGFGTTFALAGGSLLVFLVATLVRPRIWLGRA